MSHQRTQFEQLLDEHLAGTLAGDDLRRFEAMLEANPELRDEVEAHRAIASSLREQLKAPADLASKVKAVAHAAPREQPVLANARSAAPKARQWSRRLAIAAMLVLGVFGAWRTWEYLAPGPPPYPDTGPKRTPVAAYHEVIAAGYEPEWICRNDQEFLENVRKSLGEDLLVDQSDPAVRVVGLSYANTISPWTVLILSYVKGEPVVVFADRILADRNVPSPTSPELSWHRREIGDVVLYELTPFEVPMILPRFYQLEDDAIAPPA